jgi:hypothetical protein
MLLKYHKKYNYPYLKYSAHCFGHIDQDLLPSVVSSIALVRGILCIRGSIIFGSWIILRRYYRKSIFGTLKISGRVYCKNRIKPSILRSGVCVCVFFLDFWISLDLKMAHVNECWQRILLDLRVKQATIWYNRASSLERSCEIDEAISPDSNKEFLRIWRGTNLDVTLLSYTA